MDLGDDVETSDLDERESFNASRPQYWSSIMSSPSPLIRGSHLTRAADVRDFDCNLTPSAPVDASFLPGPDFQTSNHTHDGSSTSNSISRSLSMDPLALCTPEFHVVSRTPSPTMSYNNLPPDDQGRQDGGSLHRKEEDTTTVHEAGSPRSPAIRTQFIDSYSAEPAPLSDLRANQSQSWEEEMDIKRYSFRTRNARQLNPYAYDQANYRRQMRSNPDAIVKVVSPERHGRAVRERSRFEQMDKPKDRNTNSGSEGEGDRYNVRERGRPRKRRKTKRSGEVQVVSDAELTQVREGGEERSRWYPAAYDEVSSSGENTSEGEDIIMESGREAQGNMCDTSALISTLSKPSKANSGAGLRQPRTMSWKSSNCLDPADHVLCEENGSIGRHSTPELGPFPDFISRSRSPSLRSATSGHREERRSAHDSRAKKDPSLIRIDSSPPRPSHRNYPSPALSASRSQSSSPEMTAKDRRRMRALARMMPAVMINRQMAQERGVDNVRAIAKSHYSSDNQSSDGEDEEERGLLPGQSKVRNAPSGRWAEVRGDSESSEQESLLVEKGREADIIDVPESSDEEEDLNVEGVQEDRVDLWLIDDLDGVQGNSGGLKLKRKVGGECEKRQEASLVDWMLSRTRSVGGKQQVKKRLRRTGRRGSRSSGLDVVTSGAKRYGKSRQILLDFKNNSTQDGHGDDLSRLNSQKVHHRRSGSLCPHPSDEEIFDPKSLQRLEEKTTCPRKNKRLKRLHAQAGVHVFGTNGQVLEHGRRARKAVTVDLEDEGFHQALVPCDEANRHRRVSDVGTNLRMKGTAADFASMTGCLTQMAPVHTRYEPCDRRVLDDIVSTNLSAHEIKPDCGIPAIPPGLTFAPETYLGKGWLHELIKVIEGTSGATVPPPCMAFEITLGPTSTPQEVCQALPVLFDKLIEYAAEKPWEEKTGRPDTTSSVTTTWSRPYETIIRILCLLVSWLLVNPGNAEALTQLRDTIRRESDRLVVRLDDYLAALASSSTLPDRPALNVSWFLVELSIRTCLPSENPVTADDSFFTICVALLVRCLKPHRLRDILASVVASHATIDTASAQTRAAELWICLIHLTAATKMHLPSSRSPSFWKTTLSLMDEQVSDTGLAASELIWRTISGLLSISKFSVHGRVTAEPHLPAAWELVELALTRIRLTVDPESERDSPEHSLVKRDAYIRMVTLRCLSLCQLWHWEANNAQGIFAHLVEIFKSRKFANLLDEPSDFPSFIRKNDIGLLSHSTGSDTAFALFLKLVVHAANDLRERAPSTYKSKVKKMLALAVPVGSVPFTKANPPTGRDLSMLYNRYSAVAVAIFLEPAVETLRFRLAHVRRYVSFKDADFVTRMACIRGMMHLAILLRHCCLPLDDLLDWLSEITNSLINDYMETEHVAGKLDIDQSRKEGKIRIILTVQMILGSIRHILETPTMDGDRSTASEYPNPLLMTGPWITRVFSNTTNLANVKTTGLEIRRLVQTFLNVRASVMPKPPQPRYVPAENNVLEESQEEYGNLNLDMDDPELLAALGEVVESPSLKVNSAKDAVVCQVIDQHISPAIYRLVCKHINDPLKPESPEDYWPEIDQWIDCWVGCAHIVVTNGRRDWSHYLTLGPQSWERIIEAPRRRRVGLRFMYMVLLLDPPAYAKYEEQFIEVFMEAIAASKISFENKYMLLFFGVGGLRYPLFRGISWIPGPDGELSKTEFASLRLHIVEEAFNNLANSLHEQGQGRHELRAQNQRSLGYIVTLLATMRDNIQEMDIGSEDHFVYESFCRRVVTLLHQHPILKSHPRLEHFAEWCNTIL